jgi:hypothetical protein
MNPWASLEFSSVRERSFDRQLKIIILASAILA